MKLALAQMKMHTDMRDNFEHSLSLLEHAASRQADLVLFPEVQLSPFFAQYPGRDATPYALDLSHEYFVRFCGMCKKLRIMAAPNFYYRENGLYFDASFLISSSGECLGIQKMVHIAQAKQFYEQDYYSPSDNGFQVFDTPFGNIGIVICFDRHYPESMRTSALKGAELILIPTANTTGEPMELFEQEIRVQAFQNSVFAAMCNRVGREEEMDFSGESLVVAPDGQTLRKAGDGEELLLVDIDLQRAREMRTQRPYFSLQRPEYYC